MTDQGTGDIEIQVNGNPVQVATGSTVIAALEQLGLSASRVAVERNRELVRRSEWERVVLEPGDHLEIVEFVGGG